MSDQDVIRVVSLGNSRDRKSARYFASQIGPTVPSGYVIGGRAQSNIMHLEKMPG
jgi:hypothetical protein